MLKSRLRSINPARGATPIRPLCPEADVVPQIATASAERNRSNAIAARASACAASASFISRNLVERDVGDGTGIALTASGSGRNREDTPDR
jgi:hypothetical protein